MLKVRYLLWIIVTLLGDYPFPFTPFHPCPTYPLISLSSIPLTSPSLSLPTSSNYPSYSRPPTPSLSLTSSTSFNSPISLHSSSPPPFLYPRLFPTLLVNFFGYFVITIDITTGSGSIYIYRESAIPPPLPLLRLPQFFFNCPIGMLQYTCY